MQSLFGSSSQLEQLSRYDSPPQILLQSKTFPAQSHSPGAIPKPSHTLHSSNTLLPPKLSEQSLTTDIDNKFSLIKVEKLTDCGIASASSVILLMIL